MAITLVSKNDNYVISTTPSVTIPSTTVNANDLIIVWICRGWNAAAPSVEPSGYTGICAGVGDTNGDDRWSRMYYKVAAGGEEDDTIQWTFAGSNDAVMGVIVLRGCDVSTIWDVTPVHATHHLYGTGDSSPTLASVTPSVDGSCVICVSTIVEGGTAFTNITTDGAGVEWFKSLNGAWNHSGYGTYEIQGTAGNVQDTHTYVTGNGNDYMDMVVAILESSGASPVASILQQH